MPIYEYYCPHCDRDFELFVRGATAVACPACGTSRVERVMSVTARPAGGPASADSPRPGPSGAGGGCGGGGCGCH